MNTRGVIDDATLAQLRAKNDAARAERIALMGRRFLLHPANAVRRTPTRLLLQGYAVPVSPAVALIRFK